MIKNMGGFTCDCPELEGFNFVSVTKRALVLFLNIFKSLKIINDNERVSLNEHPCSELVQVEFSIWQVTVIVM